MTLSKCAERARLENEVSDILGKLTELTAAQLEAFRSHDHAGFMRLDKELELTIGKKERHVGALRQHVKDHACQL